MPCRSAASCRKAGCSINCACRRKGLSGHLDEFWPDLGPQSAWLGGSGEGWERGPYFLDGLVPLAYLTQDATLIAKVKKWMDWTLDHQQPDGAIGPVKNLDWWPNYVMLKALMQYQEASGDARVIPLMEKYFAYQARHMDERPLKEWAIFRWHDEVLSVLWLYNRNGDRALLDLARKLHTQGHDWEAQFANFKTNENVAARRRQPLHPRRQQRDGDEGRGRVVAGHRRARATATASTRCSTRWTAITASPRESSARTSITPGATPRREPNCAPWWKPCSRWRPIWRSWATPAFGDRLEKIAYNALPATLSADLWAHQYDQQANQVMCSISNRRWATNGPESNIFGLEPNFGCCTANMHQGWPKLAAQPVDGDAGWRPRRRGVRPQRSHRHGARRQGRDASRKSPTIRSAKPSRWT